MSPSDLTLSGIWIAASLVTIIALGIIGGGLFARASGEERRFLGLLTFLHLPMCAIAFHGVRMPLDRFVRDALGTGDFYRFVTIFYAPLTEEPAKLWVLLIPILASRITRANALRAAFAIGLGFGIGEAWLVASWIAGDARYAVMPWHQFGGYIGERLMVAVLHGCFTATAFRSIREKPARSILFAMFLHYLGNFPIYVARLDPLGFGKDPWMALLTAWVPLYLAALALFLVWWYGLALDDLRVTLNGRAECPSCGAVYVRPIFYALNSFTTRYERCPACRRWHWTRRWKEDDEVPQPQN
jgi:hypothetical protein